MIFRKFVTLFWGILCFFKVSAQNEYRYFSIRLGLNHHFFAEKTNNVTDKFLESPDGEMLLFSDNKLKFSYDLTYTMNLFYHFDFKNDKVGIVAGIEYVNYGITTHYTTRNQEYTLIEKFRIQSLGFPLMLKISNAMYEQMKYLFFGVQYNYNLSLRKIESSNFSDAEYFSEGKENEFQKGNFVFIFGLNYFIFNLQLDYMPQSFLNKEYSENNFLPYKHHTGNYFFLKTSVHIPLSEWTTIRNYTAEKVRRFFKFRY